MRTCYGEWKDEKAGAVGQGVQGTEGEAHLCHFHHGHGHGHGHRGRTWFNIAGNIADNIASNTAE